MKVLYALTVIILIGVGLAAGYYLWGTNPAGVIREVKESPAAAPGSGQADLTMKSETKLTGNVTVTPIPSPQITAGDTNIPPESEVKNEGILALKTGDVLKAELTGTVATEYYNLAGEAIGTGNHRLTAQLSTTVTATGLNYELNYPDSIPIGIVYKPPNEPWLIGRLWYDGGIGADLEMRLDFNGIKPFALIRYDGEKITPMAGVEFALQ